MLTVLSVSATGWRRPIGCLKLQVIFHKKATNYRALLRKMTYEDKASCGSSTPCRSNEQIYICTEKLMYSRISLHESNCHESLYLHTSLTAWDSWSLCIHTFLHMKFMYSRISIHESNCLESNCIYTRIQLCGTRGVYVSTHFYT